MKELNKRYDQFGVWKYDMTKPKTVCPHCGYKKTEYYENDGWYCPYCDNEWDERDGLWWDINGGRPLEVE
mgnify:FL=1